MPSSGGEISDTVRTSWAEKLTPLFPAGSSTRDATLLELLVWLRAPAALDRGFAALATAVTHEARRCGYGCVAGGDLGSFAPGFGVEESGAC